MANKSLCEFHDSARGLEQWLPFLFDLVVVTR